MCSCLSRDSGQPDFTCRRCHGSGYIYMPEREITVAATMIDGRLAQDTLRLYEPGNLYITPQTGDIIMGYHDRLRFPDFRCVFSEAVRFDGSLVSGHTYRNIVEPVRLCDTEYELEEGVDYEVAPDRHHIRYIGAEYADHIRNGTLSLLYYTTPSYLVVDLVHELRATLSDRNSPGGALRFMELPKQYRARREDFLYGVKDPVTPEDGAAGCRDEAAGGATPSGPGMEGITRTDSGYVI